MFVSLCKKVRTPWKLTHRTCDGKLYIQLYCLTILGRLTLLSINLVHFSLTSTSPAHKYYLAMDPMGEVLYVSDTSSRRVYRVRNLGQPKDPSRNLEVVAGTGEQCLPFDQSHCGEGRKATEAALNNPRGRRMYRHYSWRSLFTVSSQLLHTDGCHDYEGHF